MGIVSNPAYDASTTPMKRKIKTVPRLHMPIIALLALGMSVLSYGQTLDGETLENALRAPGRDVNDRIRDPQRKPVDTLLFLQLKPGMRVLDLYAAGGYYTYILAKAVGPEGLVYAQNSPSGLNLEEDRGERSRSDALMARITAGNLDNVERLERPVNDLGLAANSIDFILISQILHDYYNSHPQRALNMLQQLNSILKPGGIIGVIDHEGLAERDNRRLHRLPKAEAISIIEAAGFVVEAQSDLLANPQDTHVRSIFDPMLNRATDQYLLRLRKP